MSDEGLDEVQPLGKRPNIHVFRVESWHVAQLPDRYDTSDYLTGGDPSCVWVWGTLDVTPATGEVKFLEGRGGVVREKK